VAVRNNYVIAAYQGRSGDMHLTSVCSQERLVKQGDGQFKHPSLASFEYELPSALRQLLLRRTGFLILHLEIIHDLRHVGHSSRHFLGACALVLRVHFSG